MHKSCRCGPGVGAPAPPACWLSCSPRKPKGTRQVCHPPPPSGHVLSAGVLLRDAPHSAGRGRIFHRPSQPSSGSQPPGNPRNQATRGRAGATLASGFGGLLAALAEGRQSSTHSISRDPLGPKVWRGVGWAGRGMKQACIPLGCPRLLRLPWAWSCLSSKQTSWAGAGRGARFGGPTLGSSAGCLAAWLQPGG